MSNNPYKVLGVPENATDDEITSAYRKLAKKYHPDLNHGSKESEEKMSEINAAYEEIKKIRSGESSGTNSGYGYGNSYSSNDRLTQLLNSTRVYINARQYEQALNVLNSIDISDHNAEWYHLSAIANYGCGNSITALNHAKQAVSMNPNNYEYRHTLEIIQSGGHIYNTGRGNYGSTINVDGLCTSICLAKLCCDLCSCLFRC